MPKGECSVAGCDRPVKATKLCWPHYMRKRRRGHETEGPTLNYTDHEGAFAARRKRDGDCIVWTGALSTDGYGHLKVQGRDVKVHRYAWERKNGPIPDGLLIDHMCWNRACVNVEHLRLANRTQNAQNRIGAQSTSRSGIRGVSQLKGGRWQSLVKVDGVYHYQFSATAEEAEQKAIAMRRALMPFSQEPELIHEH